MKSIMNILQTKRAVLCSLMVMFLGLSSFAQVTEKAEGESFEITGQVLDAHSKKPIVAAQINALNVEASATTDEEGKFTIKVKDKSEVLVIKAFDYDLREYPVRGATEVKILLYPDVFTDNYFKVKNFGGKAGNSQTVRSAKQISDLNQINDISADKVIQRSLGADVRSVSRSGLAGVGNTMFIRGLNSVYRNAQPLFVVDGVIWANTYNIESVQPGYYSNPLSFIDVNDIASIQVLKDGTSIYGSKAANGVIFIETKEATDIVTTINANASYGIVSEPTLTPVMEADDYRVYLSDMIGSNEEVSNEDLEEFSFFNDDPTSIDYYNYHNNTDWGNEVYQEGVTQSYNVNVRGGDSRALYYFSLAYAGADGIVKNTSMERLSTRMNADFNMTELLDIKFNIGFTNIDRELQDDGMLAYSAPRFLSMVKAPFLYPYQYAINGDVTANFADADVFGVGNPSALLNNSINTSKQHRFNIGATPTVKLTPYLEISDKFDMSVGKAKEFYFSPMAGRASILTEDGIILENAAANQFYRNRTINNDLQLTYNRKIEKHSLNGIVGSRFITSRLESDMANGYNTGSDQKTVVSTSLEYLDLDGYINNTVSFANYIYADYNYANKYMLSATASLETSSLLGDNVDGTIDMIGAQWELFPSVNAGWLVSSEPFMKNISFINLLKLRAGYSITGNDDIVHYSNRTSFNMQRYISFLNGAIYATLANNEIKWETTSRYNAGLDINLFNERVSLSADVYQSKTKDLLSMYEYQDVTGLSGYYWANGGELENKGFEFAANIKLLNLNDFQWEIGAQVGHYKNEVTSFPGGQKETELYGASILTQEGSAAGVFYGYKTAGVFATTADAQTANLKMTSSDGEEVYFGAGDVIFEDVNTDNIIDSKDMQVIGDPNPDFYGSFSTSMALKGFKLDALFTYSLGNDIYNYQRRVLESGLNYYNQSTAILSRWQKEGQVTTMPKTVYGDPMGNSRFSDRWIEDGSYLKLKTISLSYDLPVKSGFLNGVNIWVSANNLWTLTDYLGLDPEVAAGNGVLMQGIDAGLLPVTESYFVGVRLDL